MSIPRIPDAKEFFTYAFCGTCSHYFRSTQITGEKEHGFYDKGYAGFFEKRTFSRFLKIAYTRLKAHRYRKYIKGRNILEIGSGAGHFLHACTQYSPRQCEGVELSQHASDYARKRYGLNITQMSFDNFLPSNHFDTIFLFHVIEHFSDPYSAIEKIINLLKPGGAVIIETPNWDSWERRIFRTAWRGWSAPYHTYIFSPRALTQLLKRAHFSVENVSFTLHPYSWTKNALVSLRLNASLSSIGSLFLIPFSPLFAIASYFLQKGGRMIIIARKQ